MRRKPTVTILSSPTAQESASTWRYRWKPAALGLIIGALVFAGVSFYARATGEGTDYNVFYLGGQLARERPHQLYDVPASRGPNYTFLNPPVVAVLMWPLSVLPIAASALAWCLVSVACTVHATVILGRLLAPTGMTSAFLVLTLLLGLPYTVENIMLGQIHGLILYLMVLSFAGLRAGRPVVGAGWMAAATAIKLLPGVFGVYLVARRQWRPVAAFVLFLVLSSAAPPAIALGPQATSALLGQFYRLQIAPYLSGESTQHPIYARTAVRKTRHDHDLGVLLMRHFTAEHALPGYEHLVLARLDLRTVRRSMFVGFLLMLAISVMVAWPRARDASAEPGLTDLLFAAFVVLSLLLSPRNRVAYWPVLMIPWAVLLARVMDARTPRRRRSGAAWTLGASAALCALVALPAGQAMSLGFWAQVVLWVGLLTLGHTERHAVLARP
jgi:hypothetical protein